MRTLAEVRGDGTVMSSVWRNFWNRRDTYVLDGKMGRLSTVTPELAEATVKKSFSITHTRKSKQAVANLAQGSRIQVLAAAQADEKGVYYYYYLVKSASGPLGWCNARSLLDNTEGLPRPPEKAE